MGSHLFTTRSGLNLGIRMRKTYIFLQVLCMNIKNNLLSFQGWLKKLKKLTLTILKKARRPKTRFSRK
jgi:hypothetical protein